MSGIIANENLNENLNQKKASVKRSFLCTLEQLRNYLKLAGLDMKVCSQDAINYFDSLSLQEQQSILSRSQDYLEVCSSVIENGDSLTDNNRFVWHAMKQARYLPSDDFFLKIEEGDVVEFYCDYVQMTRNINFFKYCSYSLGDIFVFPWYKLFYRSDELNNSIFEKVTKYMTERPRGTFDPDIERHVVYEIFSDEKFYVSMKAKYFAVFRNANDGVPDALVIVSSCEQVEPRPIGPEPTAH